MWFATVCNLGDQSLIVKCADFSRPIKNNCTVFSVRWKKKHEELKSLEFVWTWHLKTAVDWTFQKREKKRINCKTTFFHISYLYLAFIKTLWVLESTCKFCSKEYKCLLGFFKAVNTDALEDVIGICVGKIFPSLTWHI